MPDLPRAPVSPIAAPENREIAPSALARSITPAEAHFVRCHFAPPRPPAEVVIGGAVADPARFDLAALRSLEQRTLVVTLECAGTGRLGVAPLPPGEPWGRGAVSTAVWTGVPLQALLERAHLRDDVVEILVRGADRGTPPGAPSEIAYERALPRDQEALLALEMNGSAIPVERGGPVRLIVPGWYGMASIKWVTTLDALTEPFQGWFQTHDYVYDDGPVTTMRVNSRIVEPAGDSRVMPGRVRAWGWAWSGGGAIARVEVSLDAGPWHPVAVEQSGPSAWARWDTDVGVARAGGHTLRARAWDALGEAQPEAPVHNRLGYGNNAVETVRFFVG